jgi:uncharacterized OB-fold protein
MFCKHKWSILSEMTTESTIEKAKKLGLFAEYANAFDLKKKHILVLQCENCGKEYLEKVEEI